jgi:hypothetical protein
MDEESMISPSGVPGNKLAPTNTLNDPDRFSLSRRLNPAKAAQFRGLLSWTMPGQFVDPAEIQAKTANQRESYGQPGAFIHCS